MENITEKLENFNKHKKLSVKVNLEQRYKHNKKKAEVCGECGSFLSFDLWRNKETNDEKRTLESANFCKVKWCPMCAWRKTRKLAGEIKSTLEQIEAQYKVRYLFLTLTIKNPPLTELRNTIKYMSNAFKLLTKNKLFKKNVLGYIRAIEYLGDETKSGEAHPHYHIILAVNATSYFGGNYISQAKWTELWKQALKADYTPIVDIRTIRAKNEKWKDSDSAIFETLKYCVAPLELVKLSQENFKELDKQTKGARQYNKGGLIKTIKPLPNATLDPELWEYMKTEYFNFVNGEYKKCATKKEADQKNHIKQKQKVSDSQN